MVRMFIAAIIALSLVSCDKNSDEIDNGIDKEQIALIKSKAVETLTIGSNTFVLGAYLWRDFQPICPEDGQPMTSLNHLVDVGMVDIPDNISMIKQYVFYGDLVWVADYDEDVILPDFPKYKQERISSGGPKWGPEVYVDVISQIYDSDTGESYFIECKAAHVGRTD